MVEEHIKTEGEVIDEQLEFFSKSKSGCAFAAVAAKDPGRYEWSHSVCAASDSKCADGAIEAAISDPAISTLSLIFPEVRTSEELAEFIPNLLGGRLHLFQALDTERNRCYRIRLKLDCEESFVSGFGPFDFMPITRQTPHTGLVMRVKPRPNYDWFLKPPEDGIVHVADMDMKGMSEKHLRRLWNNSFLTTRGILGKEPDDESAAKTTFVIPIDRANKISI